MQVLAETLVTLRVQRISFNLLLLVDAYVKSTVKLCVSSPVRTFSFWEIMYPTKKFLQEKERNNHAKSQ